MIESAGPDVTLRELSPFETPVTPHDRLKLTMLPSVWLYVTSEQAGDELDTVVNVEPDEEVEVALTPRLLSSNPIPTTSAIATTAPTAILPAYSDMFLYLQGRD